MGELERAAEWERAEHKERRRAGGKGHGGRVLQPRLLPPLRHIRLYHKNTGFAHRLGGHTPRHFSRRPE